MPADDSDNETPPILVRVPSNVVNAATADAMPDNEPEREKRVSETESVEEPQPEFKEGGYGW